MNNMMNHYKKLGSVLTAMAIATLVGPPATATSIDAVKCVGDVCVDIYDADAQATNDSDCGQLFNENACWSYTAKARHSVGALNLGGEGLLETKAFNTGFSNADACVMTLTDWNCDTNASGEDWWGAEMMACLFVKGQTIPNVGASASQTVFANCAI